MNIPINTTIDKFFKTAIKVLNPVLKLSKTETEVLANIMLVMYANRNASKEKLEKHILSYKSRVALRSKLELSEASLNNNISSLKKKGVIVRTENGFNLSDSIRRLYPENNKLSITFNIVIK